MFDKCRRRQDPIASGSLTKIFRDSVARLCNSHAIGSQRSLKVLDLRFGSGDSSSTTNLFINLTNVASLELDFGRLSTAIKVSKDKALDVSMKINRLEGLTQEDLHYIQRCHPVSLSIVETPEESDEERLANILQHNPSIAVFRVGFPPDRSLAIIDLIKSTVKMSRQDTNSSILRALTAVDEGLIPLNDNTFECTTRMAVTVFFSAKPRTFDIETHISLQDAELSSMSPVYDFFRQYGWSIKTLRASRTFNDRLATLLDNSTRKGGSRIKSLFLDPSLLTTSGLDALDRAIKRSKSIDRLALNFFYWRPETQKALLGRYADKLCDLRICGYLTGGLITEPTQAFPTRSSFPVLKHFRVTLKSISETSHESLQWILSMISPPADASVVPPREIGIWQSESPGSLTSIEITGLQLRPGAWRSLINAIDFSSLVSLKFFNSNLSLDQLKGLGRSYQRSGRLPCTAERGTPRLLESEIQH